MTLYETMTRLIQNHIDLAEGDIDYAKTTAGVLTDGLVKAVRNELLSEVAVEAACDEMRSWSGSTLAARMGITAALNAVVRENHDER